MGNSNVTPTPTKPQILPKTLLEMIDEINRSSPGSTYFNTTNDFCVYLKIITEKGYTLSRLKEDVRIGQGYVYFLESHAQQGFSDIQTESTPIPDHQSQFDIFQYFADGINSLFGIKEGLETTSPSTSPPTQVYEPDNIILSKFGITDFNVQLKKTEDILRTYGVKDLSSDKEWTNIIKVIDKLSYLSITFENLEEFVNLMNDFGANAIKKWYDVLTKLTYIKITGYANIKQFILLITQFGVKYDTNFTHFIEVLVSFKTDLSSSMNPITKFVRDMKDVGYRYDQSQTYVDNIITYFIKCRYTLDTYSYRSNSNSINSIMGYSGETCKTNPNILPPSGLPSMIVRSFYGLNTKLPHFSNSLYDIRTPSLLEDLQFCDVIDSMQQAYMIANESVNSYNDATANFIPNSETIVPFFYSREFFQIYNDIDKYNNYPKVVSLMRDVAKGMDNFSATLNGIPEQKDNYNMYISLAKTIRVFPVICFQWLSYRIKTQCSNNPECKLQNYSVEVNPQPTDYSKYVNPNLTYSKAGEPTNIKPQPVKYRPSNPIL
jgi:hypothetical protein